jgi:hypothetical protein
LGHQTSRGDIIGAKEHVRWLPDMQAFEHVTVDIASEGERCFTGELPDDGNDYASHAYHHH